MSRAGLDPARFRLAEGPNGGVLLDLHGGAYLRLNTSGASLASRLLRGGSLEDTPGAAPLVDRIEALCAQPPPSASAEGLHIEPDGDVFVLSWDRVPQVEIHHDRLRWRAEPHAQGLIWAAPHILVRRGWLPVHASSVHVDGRVVPFIGGTGAGKSTLAALLAQASDLRRASDDLVLLRPKTDEVVSNFESALRAWANERAAERDVEIASLEATLGGLQSAPLGTVRFLRRGSAVGDVALEATRGLAQFLENAFAELSTSEVWQTVFEAGVRLCFDRPSHELVVPDGLEDLAAARSKIEALIRDR